jgi:CDP-glucose 4,6-dehydratase
MGISKTFWEGRRVLITGHNGFKGSWLSVWLQSLGAEVTGIALAPEINCLFELASVGSGMHTIVGDIRDADTVQKAMISSSPEAIIHLAAQSLVRVSYEEPLTTFATNVMGTANVLEAVRHCPSVRAVVNVTSDKCYENREWIWGYRENEAMGGHDPYSASKACAEIVGAALRSSFFPPTEYARHGVAIASARAGNVVGGGDTARDRLIPDIVAAFAAGRSAIVRNPAAVRPWQHVLEPLSGYLMLAEKLYVEGAAYAEAWNFGPRDEDMQPVARIADAMVKRWGDGACWTTTTGSQPHEAQVLRLDCSKAVHRLGWVPRWTLDHALDAIVDWHRTAISKANMHEFTLKQIEAWQK